MKHETLDVNGVSVELSLLRESAGGHWLVMARSYEADGQISTCTMPPLSPDMTEKQAWDEARAWSIRMRTKQLLETSGLRPKFASTTC